MNGFVGLHDQMIYLPSINSNELMNQVKKGPDPGSLVCLAYCGELGKEHKSGKTCEVASILPLLLTVGREENSV